ncbi:MAG: hypothetical protein Q9221_006806 [Calogaya cf. arnoldii]
MSQDTITELPLQGTNKQLEAKFSDLEGHVTALKGGKLSNRKSIEQHKGTITELRQSNEKLQAKADNLEADELSWTQAAKTDRKTIEEQDWVVERQRQQLGQFFNDGTGARQTQNLLDLLEVLERSDSEDVSFGIGENA